MSTSGRAVATSCAAFALLRRCQCQFVRPDLGRLEHGAGGKGVIGHSHYPSDTGRLQVSSSSVPGPSKTLPLAPSRLGHFNVHVCPDLGGSLCFQYISRSLNNAWTPTACLLFWLFDFLVLMLHPLVDWPAPHWIALGSCRTHSSIQFSDISGSGVILYS